MSNPSRHHHTFSPPSAALFADTNLEAFLAEQLAGLQEMPASQFTALIMQLIKAMGYPNVSRVKPTLGRGRSSYGGFDLIAHLPTDLTRTMLIAQVKQYRRPVRRSFVDELRGAMLRCGARHGLMISTSTFSQAAQAAVLEGQRSFPIRLIAGEELARLLHSFGLSFDAVAKPASQTVTPKPYPTRQQPKKRRKDKVPRFHEVSAIAAPSDMTITLSVKETLVVSAHQASR